MIKGRLSLYGGIEAGGTKFICAAGTGPNDLRDTMRIPTTNPDETIGRAVEFFRNQEKHYGPLTALGVASFGPVDPDPQSVTFGYITSTPKAGWSNTNMIGRLKEFFDLPIGFDTDVNGAALAEYCWGAARDVDSFIYMTVGTGIGGGAIINGQVHHGLAHPEVGHMMVPHDWHSDPYPGCCPYHGDCLEGMASGPAIEGRWGKPGTELPARHPAWDLEAKYLSLALHNLICTISPRRIIIGGGVMKQSSLLALLREEVPNLLNGYIAALDSPETVESFIVPPALGNMAGVLGALALAEKAYISVSPPG